MKIHAWLGFFSIARRVEEVRGSFKGHRGNAKLFLGSTVLIICLPLRQNPDVSERPANSH